MLSRWELLHRQRLQASNQTRNDIPFRAGCPTHWLRGRCVPSIFHCRQDRRVEGLERGWGSWRGTATPSQQLGVWGALWPPPVWFGAEPRPPKGFSLLSALRMASPDTIILLTVDYHAAIGGQDPRYPRCVRPWAATIQIWAVTTLTWKARHSSSSGHYALIHDQTQRSTLFRSTRRQLDFSPDFCLVSTLGDHPLPGTRSRIVIDDFPHTDQAQCTLASYCQCSAIGRPAGACCLAGQPIYTFIRNWCSKK